MDQVVTGVTRWRWFWEPSPRPHDVPHGARVGLSQKTPRVTEARCVATHKVRSPSRKQARQALLVA